MSTSIRGRRRRARPDRARLRQTAWRMGNSPCRSIPGAGRKVRNVVLRVVITRRVPAALWSHWDPVPGLARTIVLPRWRVPLVTRLIRPRSMPPQHLRRSRRFAKTVPRPGPGGQAARRQFPPEPAPNSRGSQSTGPPPRDAERRRFDRPPVRPRHATKVRPVGAASASTGSHRAQRARRLRPGRRPAGVFVIADRELRETFRSGSGPHGAVLTEDEQ